jgi:hypothetical protein
LAQHAAARGERGDPPVDDACEATGCSDPQRVVTIGIDFHDYCGRQAVRNGVFPDTVIAQCEQSRISCDPDRAVRAFVDVLRDEWELRSQLIMNGNQLAVCMQTHALVGPYPQAPERILEERPSRVPGRTASSA